MEIFSFNLITIGLVILILAVYRYLDKNNRSLEKVKKFTDKELERLAGAIDKKTQEIQNLAIELQVNLKTGKEILKRISDSETELDTRAGDFETLKMKIREYDTLIEELNKATKTVDDNIKKIHEESGFVEKVAKTIKAAQSKMDEIGSSIPVLKEEFNKKISEDSKIEKQNIFDEIKTRMLATHQETALLEKRLKDYAAFMTKLESRRVEMEGESKKSFEKHIAGLELKIKEKCDTASAEFHKNLDGIVGNANSEVLSINENITSSLSNYKKNFDDLNFSCEDRLISAREKGNSIEQDIIREIETAARRAKDEADNSLIDISNEIESVNALYEEKFENIREIGNSSNEEIIKKLEKLSAHASDEVEKAEFALSSVFEGFKDEMNATCLEYEKKLVSLRESGNTIEQKIAATLENATASARAEVEKAETALITAVAKFGNGMKDADLQIEKKLDNLHESGNVIEQKIAAALGKVNANARAEVEKAETALIAAVAKFGDEMNAAGLQMEKRIDSVRESENVIEQKIAATLENAAASAKAEVEKAETALIAAVAKFGNEMNAVSIQMENRIDSVRESGETLEQEVAARFNAYVIKSSNELRKTFEEKLSGVAFDIEKRHASVEKEMETLTRFEADMDARVGGIKNDFDSTVSKMIISVDDFKKRFDNELEAASVEIESKMMKKIENRLSDYENDCNYKFKKLEDSHFDIQKFETNLNELMEIKKADAQIYFESFIAGLEESAVNKKKEHDRIIFEMSDSLKSLDQEIKGLKSKAYQDVSEKMKFFEDEFFSDLKSRNEKIELSFNGWEREVNSNLESKYSELDKKIDNRFSSSESEWENRINVKLVVLNDKFVAVENQFEIYRSTLKSDLEEIGKKQSEIVSKNALLEKAGAYMGRLEKELVRIKKEMDELDAQRHGFKEFEEESRHSHARAIEYSQKVELILNDSNVKIEALKNDVEKEKKKVSEFTGSLDNIIEGFNESFTAKIDTYSGDLNRKAGNIEKQLAGIDERITLYSNRMEEQARAAMDKFKNELNTIEGDFTGKSKKFKEDMDSTIVVFSKTLKEDQDRLKSLQDRIFGRIETDYRTLLANFNEIDKQQKNFESQTKLFERADRLKLELKADIEELKKELQIIEPEKKKLNLIESEFIKTQKVTSEVSAKLARFFAEKNKIDEMDKNMRQLMKVSESVEKRLESVTSNHDALQEIELKLKSLYEIEQKTETQYERLEKKNQMIETTVKEVEKNFKLLDDLEKHVKRIDESVQTIPGKITSINDNIKYLAENKEKADAAIEMMNKMEGLLADIEERTNKLQVAREWLSRTETRLESIGKGANDQLNLLKALIKEDGGPDSKKGKGAPSYDTRQMIIKLARQGWSVKEIAKASSVSQGEVELVLELEPQNR